LSQKINHLQKKGKDNIININQINKYNMKQLIQRLLFGYRPNPQAETPRPGAVLTQKGGTAEQIHSALVLMQYNLKHETN
jgi:hypothetical protein